MNKYELRRRFKIILKDTFFIDAEEYELSHYIYRNIAGLVDYFKDTDKVKNNNINYLELYMDYLNSLSTDKKNNISKFYSNFNDKTLNEIFSKKLSIKDMRTYFNHLIKNNNTDNELVCNLFQQFDATLFDDFKEEYLSITKNRKPIKKYKNFISAVNFNEKYSISMNKANSRHDSEIYYSIKLFSNNEDITHELNLKYSTAKKYKKIDLLPDQKSIITIKSNASEFLLRLFKDIIYNNNIPDLFYNVKKNKFITCCNIDKNIKIKHFDYSSNDYDYRVFKVFYNDVDITTIFDFKELRSKQVSRFDNKHQKSITANFKVKDEALSKIISEVQEIFY